MPRTSQYEDDEDPSSGPTEPISTINKHLKTLKRSLKVSVPYTGGVHPTKADDLVVYYDDEDKDKQPHRIDFTTATDDELVKLAGACAKATFGVAQADVLDETYRKAGKMDLNKFASRLDVVSSGLLAAISPDLLVGQSVDSDKVLRAELYKLNVYGPGSFFKAHRDTPRSQDMIGSLVVIFPTEHTGGELTLEDSDGISWTFDAANKLAQSKSRSTPSVAYIAFYSDAMHAVQPVLTGYRVTLTNNLFLTSHTNRVVLGERVASAAERKFKAALSALLDTPAFLPDGGLLAYGLTHQYPIPTAVASGNRIAHMLSVLKGSDARIRTLSERMGLETQVMMLYDSGSKDYDPLSGHDVLVSDILDMSDVCDLPDTRIRDKIEEKAEMVLERSEDRTRELKKARKSTEEWMDEDEDEPEETVKVHWVTKITDNNRVGSGYPAYGNEVSIEHVYGNAALFVTVPAFGSGVRE
ncbi:hypothetical protein C8R45DRAFT_213896 [Mycena sanguinolenta]|nr:hypothetical protein C8R45DRAFT_213896 [Mycena sanguinolenta]